MKKQIRHIPPIGIIETPPITYESIKKIVDEFADKMPYSKWHPSLQLWEVYVYPQTIYMDDKLHDKYLELLNEKILPQP